MTSNEAESAKVSPDAGARRVQLQITLPLTPAAADARDKLLGAIGSEAQRVAEQTQGSSSTALVELARAFSMVRAAEFRLVRISPTDEEDFRQTDGFLSFVPGDYPIGSPITQTIDVPISSDGYLEAPENFTVR
ncbi:hypothetical protein ACFWAR_19495 [Streptomyces sp. NPDC059917]|uniref:hypothetical protein n=1 Tax=Streptomyces sp. NPDC059917 TaxID=3347002 RepID=UPI0036532155